MSVMLYGQILFKELRKAPFMEPFNFFISNCFKIQKTLDNSISIW